jgi:hypothetical protein
MEIVLAGEGVAIEALAEGPYRAFVRHSGSVQVAPGDLVVVRHEVAPEPGFDGAVIFKSSAAWDVRARGDERGIVAWSDGPLYAARLRPGATDVLVRCAPPLVDDGPPRTIRSPGHYPLDQILAMYLLGPRGLVVHAAGMLVRGHGIALVGVSGAGKTTFSRLAAGRDGWTPLSDDRLIVRVDGEEPKIHGTPWPGEGDIASRESGPLRALLFLEQGRENGIRGLSPHEALARLVQAASVPWYDEALVGATLDACGRLVRDVAAGVLTFAPDEGAVATVERALEAGSTGVRNRAAPA